jgi:hypothetical protein
MFSVDFYFCYRISVRLCKRRDGLGINCVKNIGLTRPQSIDRYDSVSGRVVSRRHPDKACAWKACLAFSIILTAPVDVVQFLVAPWPEAVETTNDNGWFPLHMACVNKAPIDVVQFLVET